MPPNQSTTTPPPNLDFILQAEQPKPKRFGGRTKTQRTIIVAATGIIIIIIAFVFLSFMQSRSRRGSAELIDLAAYQTELTRVIEIGAKNGQSSGVLNSAQTGRLTIMSDLIKTKRMISSVNVKLDESDLTKYKTTSIDATLDDARTANNFDAVFSDLLDKKYDDYKQKLSSTFKAQSNVKIKNTLSAFHAHVELLPFSYSP